MRPWPARKASSSESTRRERSVRPDTRRSTTTTTVPGPRGGWSRPWRGRSSRRPPARARSRAAARSSTSAAAPSFPGAGARTPGRGGGRAAAPSSTPATRSGLSRSTMRPQPGQWSVPTLAQRSFRWSRSSVSVPTVDRLPRTVPGPLDRHGRGQPVDRIHLRALHPLEELARVGGERLHVAPLALGVERVQRERGLARPRDARDHGQGPERDVDVDPLQVVLPRSTDAEEGAGRHGRATLCGTTSASLVSERGVRVEGAPGAGSGGQTADRSSSAFLEAPPRGTRHEDEERSPLLSALGLGHEAQEWPPRGHAGRETPA